MLIKPIRVAMALVAVSLCVCSRISSESGTPIGDGNGAGNTPGARGNTVVAAVSGTVSGAVINSQAAPANSASLRQATNPSDGCANANYTVYEVGGDALPVTVGRVGSDTRFAASWAATPDPTTKNISEVVFVFACPTNFSSTLKCYGKPGDTTLLCDPVAAALVTSLELALGKSLESSALYKGLSIAKMAEGWAETLKLASRINPQDDYVSELAAATSPAEVYAIVNDSPLGNMFQSIQTLAAQAVAHNNALTASLAEQRAALQAVWTVPKVVQWLVGMGVEININLDDGVDNETGLYSTRARLIDTVTHTTFNADTQVYLSDLYDSLYITKTAPAHVLLLCEGSQQSANAADGVQLVWPPDVTGMLADSNTQILTCLGPTAVALNMAVPTGGGNQPQNTNGLQTRVGAVVRSAYDESDRNDPTGSHPSPGKPANFLRMNLVDALAEFNNAISNPNGVCYNASLQDANTNAFVNLSACLQANDLQFDFAGVLGLYRFLTDPTLASIRVGLADLWSAMIDASNLRLAFYSWNRGYRGTRVMITDTGNQTDVPPLLADASSVDNSNNEILTAFCPAQICPTPTAAPMTDANMTTSQFSDLLAQTRPGFNLLFKDYLQIPDLETIKMQIATASSHVEYNSSGAPTLNIVGKGDMQPNVATRPILCQITDPNHALTSHYAPGDRVACEIAQGLWKSGAEQPASPNNLTYKDYSGWFGLSQRETIAGNLYFALIDLYTGAEVTAAGEAFRIRDISNLPSNNTSLVVADGQTVYGDIVSYCDPYSIGNGSFAPQCYQSIFQYVALNFPNVNAAVSPANDANSFYPPAQYQPYYGWALLPDGAGAPNSMPIAVTTGSADPNVTTLNNGYAVCLSNNGVSVDPNHPYVVTSIYADGNTVACSSLSSGHGPPVWYYLGLSYDANNTSPDVYNYNLLRNDGIAMQTACSQANCLATMPMSRVQAALGGLQLGPQGAQAWLPQYRVVNRRYDAKFDPYCLDLDGDGYCDCQRDPHQSGVYSQYLGPNTAPNDTQCNLNDVVAFEPTLAAAPFNPDDGVSLYQALTFINACGNRQGLALQACIQNQPLAINSLNLSSAIFACAAPPAGQSLTYLNLSDLANNPNHAGGNCGPNHSNGPVQMYKVAPRNNAYALARPQTALKLIANATQDTGTGIVISAQTDAFTLTQALSLAFFRLAMPMSGVDIRARIADNDPNMVLYPNRLPVFAQVNQPDRGIAVSSGILRAFLLKGNLTSAGP